MAKANTVAKQDRRILKSVAAIVIVVAVTLLVLSWFLTRGVEDSRVDPIPNDIPPSEQLEAGPTGTGGSDGAGTDQSNDPGIQTPSPAGGVDTNNVPAGGTSPPQ